MKRGAIVGVALVFVAVTAVLAPRVQARGKLSALGSPTSVRGPYCSGPTPTTSPPSPPRHARAEQKPQSQTWTYAIRTSATYECLSYGTDGNLRRVKKKTLAHGTGFGYRQQNGETLILTNQHVAEWPPVTDDDHKLEDVPVGCKRAVRFAQDRRVGARHLRPRRHPAAAGGHRQVDGHGHPQGPRPAAHPALEGGPLGGPRGTQRGGRARLSLGAFKATNVGKVVSTYDHDDEKDWDHVDFRGRRPAVAGQLRLAGARRLPAAPGSSSWSASTMPATRATRRSTWSSPSIRCAT